MPLELSLWSHLRGFLRPIEASEFHFKAIMVLFRSPVDLQPVDLIIHGFRYPGGCGNAPPPHTRVGPVASFVLPFLRHCIPFHNCHLEKKCFNWNFVIWFFILFFQYCFFISKPDKSNKGVFSIKSFHFSLFWNSCPCTYVLPHHFTECAEIW